MKSFPARQADGDDHVDRFLTVAQAVWLRGDLTLRFTAQRVVTTNATDSFDSF